MASAGRNQPRVKMEGGFDTTPSHGHHQSPMSHSMPSSYTNSGAMDFGADILDMTLPSPSSGNGQHQQHRNVTSPQFSVPQQHSNAPSFNYNPNPMSFDLNVQSQSSPSQNHPPKTNHVSSPNPQAVASAASSGCLHSYQQALQQQAVSLAAAAAAAQSHAPGQGLSVNAQGQAQGRDASGHIPIQHSQAGGYGQGPDQSQSQEQGMAQSYAFGVPNGFGGGRGQHGGQAQGNNGYQHVPSGNQFQNANPASAPAYIGAGKNEFLHHGGIDHNDLFAQFTNLHQGNNNGGNESGQSAPPFRLPFNPNHPNFQATQHLAGSPFSFSSSMTQDSQSAFSSLFGSVAGLGINHDDPSLAGLESMLMGQDSSISGEGLGGTGAFGGMGSLSGMMDIGTPATGISVLSSGNSPVAKEESGEENKPGKSEGVRRPEVQRADTTPVTLKSTFASLQERPGFGHTKHSSITEIPKVGPGSTLSTSVPTNAQRKPTRRQSSSRTRIAAYARPERPNGPSSIARTLSPTAGLERYLLPSLDQTHLSGRSSFSASNHESPASSNNSGQSSSMISPNLPSNSNMGPGSIVVGGSRIPTKFTSEKLRSYSMDDRYAGGNTAAAFRAENGDMTMTPVDENAVEDGDDSPPNPAMMNAEELALARKSRRRLSHNEVERKRRETINEKIQELEALLPPSIVANALAARDAETIKEEDEDDLDALVGDSKPKKASQRGRKKTVKKAALPEKLCKGTVLCLTVDLVKQMQQVLQVKNAREQVLLSEIQQLQSRLGLPSQGGMMDISQIYAQSGFQDYGQEDLRSIEELMAYQPVASSSSEAATGFEEDRGRTRGRRRDDEDVERYIQQDFDTEMTS